MLIYCCDCKFATQLELLKLTNKKLGCEERYKESSNIICFTHARNLHQKQAEKTIAKVDALKRIKPTKQSDSAKFNHDFYCLVDLFMQENYPDYAWKFDAWLEKIRREFDNNLKEENMSENEVEKIYQENWKEIIEKDGKVDLEQVKKELRDFSFMLEQVPLVYSEVSKGLLSKPNYHVDANNQPKE